MPDPQNWYDAAPPVQPIGGPVFGPAPTPKAPPVPSGYEPDPARPGALRPQQGGPADPNGGDSLDPKTVSFYAQQVLSGAPMPAMGMGKQASIMRQKVMEEVARQAGGQGLTGADLARQITHYKAQSANISNLEKQLGTVTQSEQTALANGQQFIDRSLELPGQTGSPDLNAVIQFGQRHIPLVPGHDAVSAMDVAYNTFVNEYAKVVSGSPSGSGVLSDSARREAMSMLTSNAAPSQKQAAFAQMKADMANRIAASHKVIEDSYDNLTKKPGYQVPGDLGLASLPGASPPPGGGGSNGGGDGTDGGGPPPPGVSSLDDDQRKAYDAFLAANPLPSGDAVGAFLTKLTGKTVTNGDDIAKAIAHGQGVSTTVDNKTLADKVSARVAEMKAAGDGAGTALGVGAADALTLGTADEINAFGRSVGGAFRGEGSFSDLWDVNSTANKAMEQSLQHDHPWAYTGGQLAGGLALAPLGGAAPAAEEGIGALAAYGAKTGAAFGGAYGFGSGEGANRFTDAAAGAVTGAGVGALAPYAGKFVADKVSALRAARGLAPDVADAAQAEGVDLIRPMVDPKSQDRFTALRNAPFSGPIVDGGINKATRQIEGRVADLGQGGTALEPQAMGDAARQTGLRYITQTGQQFNRLYGQIRQGVADTKIPSTNLTQQIDGLISDLSETPKGNAKEISWLQDLKSDYGKDMSVDALRGLRTKIRQQIGKGDLTFGQNEARVASLADAASQDIVKGLNAAGKGDLASKFSEVDAAYRDRMDFVGGTIQKLIGKRGQNLSGEQVYQNLKTMAGPRGSASGISRMREQMTPEEANDMSATFAESLGKNAKGDFQPGELVKQTDPRKMPLAMRTALFGQDGAQSIDNLRLLSKKLSDTTAASSPYRAPWRQAARAFISNITRLGPVAVGGGVGAETHSVTAGIASGAAAAGVAGVGAARRVLSARAMVNPRVSQWLAQSADVSTPQQAKQAVKGLTLVISREPALAQELTPIRDFLDQRVTQLLAANPDSQDKKQN